MVKMWRQTQTRGRSNKSRKNTTSNRRVNSTISKLHREINQNSVGKKKKEETSWWDYSMGSRLEKSW